MLISRVTLYPSRCGLSVFSPVSNKLFRVGERVLKVFYRIPFETAVVIVSAVKNIGCWKASFRQARSIGSAAYQFFFQCEPHFLRGLPGERDRSEIKIFDIGFHVLVLLRKNDLNSRVRMAGTGFFDDLVYQLFFLIHTLVTEIPDYDLKGGLRHIAVRDMVRM